jgi:hypothetical protein
MRARLRSRSFVVVVALVAILAISATVVLANHDFSDVPNSAFYHDAVSYIVDRNITAGCGGGKYCPDNSVTRGQMAVFLKAAMNAVTPKFIRDEEFSDSPIDLDDTTVIRCQTAAHVAPFPQTARVDGWMSVEAAGALGALFRLVYSTNGGTVWTELDSTVASRLGASTAGEWAHSTNMATLNLTAGEDYIFGIRVGRDTGTADSTAHRCETLVEVVNRNA